MTPSSGDDPAFSTMKHHFLAPRLATLLLLSLSFGLTAISIAAPRYESGLLSKNQPTATTWHSAVFASPFTAPPVVVIGPSTNNDTQGVTVRVRNVTANGFEYQFDEWDFLDGIHAAEAVNYIALEPGVHQIGGLQWQAARISGVTRTAQAIPLASGFPAAPVVIAQVETVNNTVAVVSRVQSVTQTAFNLRLQTQESNTAALNGESVGFVAISPGSGVIDGAPFLAGFTGASVTQNWNTLTFGGTYRQSLFFAQSQTNNGGDPFSIRRRNLTNTGVELFLQEEQSNGAEVNHVGENVGFLVLGESIGEIRAKLEVGSISQAQASSTAWTPVTFDQPYNNPVVVFGPISQGNADPVGIRVRNVTSAGFEFQLDEWDYLDGAHPADAVSYIVAEQGSYVIGGLRWQFGKSTGATHLPAAQTFVEAFSSAPVLLTQVATANGTAAVSERISNLTATGFTLQLSEEEAADGTHVAEEVHYLAVQPGSGRLVSNTLVFEAATSAANVTNVFRQLNFAVKVADPFILAEVQTRNEADPIVLRYRDLHAAGVDVRAQEETSRDAEVTHGNESVGYLAFAGAVDLDGDGLPDSWEISNGLNPNNVADANSDPDNDGITNLNEYRYATNPNTFDSGGTITVQTITPEAFEKEGTAARFRINRTGGTVPVTVNFALSGLAASGDYIIKNNAGATLAGSVTIGFNAASADVVIEPVLDTIEEYPETAILTVTPNSRYSIGAANAATVTVFDATAIPANEQLFVAFLGAQGTAQTYASGIATFYLNGPKTTARVNLSFSGLTSNQTNAYIRYGVPSGIGPELRPTLPIGQVVNEAWNIVPVGALTGQNIIDALYQAGGKYVYVNIGTGNYPAGEITGIVSRQTGSTTFTPPPTPPAVQTLTGDALTRDVSRFLTQATFGPKQAEIDSLVSTINNQYAGDRIAAFSTWIDNQFALDQTKLLDFTQAADADEWARRGTNPIDFTNNDEPRYNNRRRGWWTIAAQANDQLRQRVAFALSEIFVVSDNETEVRNRHYGTANFYDTLGTRADGNYRTLLAEVSKSPVMGKYLSHLKNQKAIIDPGSGQVLISPDENYAREIMQLFSIGLVQRHPDGTLKLGADGLPIPTYTNADITELARVLTGWSFSKRHGSKASGYPVEDNTNFNQGDGPKYFQASWTNPLKNFAAYHDTGAKTVLSTSIAAGLNGQQDLDAALDILFNHPNVAPFISRVLIQRLVTSNPSAGYVHRVAQKFANNGSGVRGNLKAVVKAILLDYEARSPEVVANIGYGKQKEPILRYLQLVRALDGRSNLPVSQLTGYGYPASQLDNFPAGATLLRYPDTDNQLSQTPQSAPSVFNWFLPDFNPGGAVAGAGLVAPELQLSTETTVIQAINYHFNLTNNDNGQNVNELIGQADPLDENVRIDRTGLIQFYDSEIASGKSVTQAATSVLDRIDVLFTAGNLKAQYASAAVPNPRSIIINTASALSVTSAGRVKELLYLLLTSPEYIHQK